MSVDVATEAGKAPQQIAPTSQIPASVFKDEGRDTSGDAVARNELGPKSGYVAPVEPTPAQGDAPPPPPPPSEPPAPTDKLLAGKYKSVEELEKGYLESQKSFMSKVQEEAAKKAEALAETRAQEIITDKFRSLVGDQQAVTQVQQTAVKSLGQMNSEELLDLFTKDPAEYNRRQQAEMLRTIRANQVQEQWRQENQDLLKMEIIPAKDGKEAITGESLVSYFNLTLAQQRPELLNDGTGSALLRESTAVVRNLLATQQNLGKQQAMTVRETVTSLQTPTQGSAAGDNRSAPPTAPAKDVDPVEAEVERQRAEQARITRQPVVRR